MSTLAEVCDQAMADARDLKERRVKAATGGGDTDIGALVEGWRAERPVVRIVSHLVQRDDMLAVARVLAIGFSCDVIAATNEGWKAPGDTPEASRRNPLTGRPWEPGEMQELAEQHDAVARGWLTESLTTLVVNRAGDMAGGSQDYRVTASTSVLGVVSYGIEWLGDLRRSESPWSGLVPDSLVAFMNEPTVAEEMARDGLTAAAFGLSAEEALACSDALTVKQLILAGFSGGVALLSDSAERAAVLEEQLRHLPPGVEVSRSS